MIEGVASCSACLAVVLAALLVVFGNDAMRRDGLILAAAGLVALVTLAVFA